MMTQSKTLLVVPYIGEFGWELMSWQGRVRWLRRTGDYDRIIVCARPDKRRLYIDDKADPKTIFCPIPPFELPGQANDDHRVDVDRRAISAESLESCVTSHVRRVCQQLGVETRGSELFVPSYRSMMWPTTAAYQRFRNLRLHIPITTDILLIPRFRGLAGERNRPESWWEEFAEVLRMHGLVVEMYEPRTDKAIEQISRSRLAVGASTGGLHLASLCGCPHYVWGSGPEARWTQMKITNRQRYETVWNPLGTPVIYDEYGWRPPMDYVVDKARYALDAIGVTTADAAVRLRLKPKWRMKRGLARLLEPAARDSIWPWRVRRLVREHLV